MTVSRVCTERCVLHFARVGAILALLGILSTGGGTAAPAAGEQDRAGDLGIRWIEVEGGTFTMGDGRAAQPVTVGRFWLSATEVTFAQYDAFCEATGTGKPDDNGWGRGDRPVLNVSHDDAVAFTRWLSGETGSTIRLPDEAEWEYAAQGGGRSGGYAFCGGADKDEVSWNEDNSGDRTHPVGTRKPNELGLFDMGGNLWEWCADRPAADPGGTTAGAGDVERGDKKALRGGSFDNPGERMGFRVSLRLQRDARHINIGFRVAKSE